MSASLTTVVKKNHDGPGTAVAGTTYPELVALVDRMQAEDGRLVFDSLRPMGDEFWNMKLYRSALASSSSTQLPNSRAAPRNPPTTDTSWSRGVGSCVR